MSHDLAATLQPKLFVALVCGLNMVPCWLLRRDGSGEAGRTLGQATLAFGIGLPLLLFKDWLPRTPTVIVGNILVLSAMGLLWQVVSNLGGRTVTRGQVALAPLAWLVCWCLPAFRDQIELRIAVAAGLTGTLVTLAMIDILRTGCRGLPQRVLLATGSLHVAISVVRAALASAHSPVTASSLWIMVTEINTLAYMMLWPALCIMLLNRQSLDAEAERGRRDELSGLLNRRGILHALDRAGAGTLLLCDIDRFKRINDRFGHAAGDAAIVAFARLAEQVLGPRMVLGRIGGEEFVALLPGGDLAGSLAVADRVRAGFAALPLAVGTDATVNATVSIGVAGKVAGEPVEMWLARADRALYRAKQSGRDRIELYSGEDGKVGHADRDAEPGGITDGDCLALTVA